MSNSCKYYTERTLGWMLNNKVIVLLSLLSFCLFVSTLAMAGQRNTLYNELEICKGNGTTVAPTTTTPVPEPTTTLKPAESAQANPPDGDKLTEGSNQEQDNGSRLLQLLSGA